MRYLKIAVGLGLAAFIGIYWSFYSIGEGEPFELDIAELRRLASSIPGERPQSIHVEEVAMIETPGSVIVAGDPFGVSKQIPILSYQILYSDYSIILETAMPANVAEELGAVSFDAQAYERVQEAMLNARHILVTHEHSDHLGGVYYHPQQSKLADKLLLTREQIAAPAYYAGLPAQKFEISDYIPLEYDHILPIAPGIVLINSPGHTAGSQMVYINLSSSEEVLFVGDIAWHYRNVDIGRPKARIASQLILREEYGSVMGQLETLNRLKKSEPEIQIIAGHDAEQNDLLIEQGVLHREFLFKSESASN